MVCESAAKKYERDRRQYWWRVRAVFRIRTCENTHARDRQTYARAQRAHTRHTGNWKRSVESEIRAQAVCRLRLSVPHRRRARARVNVAQFRGPARRLWRRRRRRKRSKGRGAAPPARCGGRGACASNRSYRASGGRRLLNGAVPRANRKSNETHSAAAAPPRFVSGGTTTTTTTANAVRRLRLWPMHAVTANGPRPRRVR